MDKSFFYEETLELAVLCRCIIHHVFVCMFVHWNICKNSLGSVFRDKCWTQECTNGDVHNPFKSPFDTHPNTWAVTQHFLNHAPKWDNFILCFPNDAFQLKGAISDFHHFQMKGNKIAMWNSHMRCYFIWGRAPRHTPCLSVPSSFYPPVFKAGPEPANLHLLPPNGNVAPPLL